MDLEQLGKRLDWLDNERRKDKLIIQTLEERLHSLVEAGFAQWNGKRFEPGEPLVINRSDQQISDLIVEERQIDHLL